MAINWKTLKKKDIPPKGYVKIIQECIISMRMVGWVTSKFTVKSLFAPRIHFEYNLMTDIHGVC